MTYFRHALDNLSLEEVRAFTREHLSNIILVDIETFESDRLHHIGVEARMLPGISASRTWSSPARADRTAAHVAQGSDDVVLVIPGKSDMTVSRRGAPDITCRPGEAYVWAGEEPLSIAYGADFSTVNIALPRAAALSLGAGVGDALMSTVDPARSGDLLMLRRYAGLLAQDEPLTAEIARLSAAHLQDLVALVLAADRRQAGMEHAQGVRAARLKAIKAEIAADPAAPLDAGAMAARHGISPRYLRALFADEDTSFTDFVLDARLERARRGLCNPRLAGRTIASIAFAAGFNDLSYFNRAFRRRHGMSPSDMRALALAGR